MITTAALVRDSLLVIHFVGLASLLGGFLVQIKALKPGTAKIIPAMIHGAWTMLVTGLLLVGAREWMSAVDAGAPELDNIKVAVKSIIATVVVVLVMLNRKKETVKSSSLALIGGVTLLNVILAVFW
ncbi:MAG: hypothetical protein F2599_04665 [Actinobacteria bacterium]|jgi:hypothetical protein|uniref:Unannotated protein n=1 Tax=freshwater metagenome TaxID=449393 RepID=A0A6J6IMJ3_9ZZZZ|nr:hypothetical protein [Actinomycetota bacterium]